MNNATQYEWATVIRRSQIAKKKRTHITHKDETEEVSAEIKYWKKKLTYTLKQHNISDTKIAYQKLILLRIRQFSLELEHIANIKSEKKEERKNQAAKQCAQDCASLYVLIQKHTR